jgi:DnaK suppressor protein
MAPPIDDTTDARRLEVMLTPEQTTQLKERLQADLTRLADHAHSALDFTMDRDRDRIGRDSMDEATEEETYSTQLRLHDRETFLLGKIREAIARLEKGEIDECEECNEPIGFKRLLARPVTTLCFECKTAREQVEADERPE